MNSWLFFIIGILVFTYFLETGISFLNLSHLSPDLPDEFKDTYDQSKYLNSQEYTKIITYFSLFQNTISTSLTILFILVGGFNYIDLFARSFELNSILTGLLFTGVLSLISMLLSLPFSLYSTFVIEERFGFNTTTLRIYITDSIKAILLAVIIGGPLLSLILWFFESTGEYGWILCWIGVFLISLILQFLAPVLIMPLFNKFTPLDEGELKDSILSYAEKEKFTIKGVFVMDGSKRSTKLNAFFTGFGKFKKIVFFDTLLEKLSADQIIAVLAHEMGHFKKKHLVKMIIASFFQTGLIFFFLSLILNNENLFIAFKMDQVSIYGSLIFFGFLYTPVSLLLSVYFNHISRKHEYEADEYAIISTGKGDDLIQGLKILSQENLSNLTPHPLNVFMHYSHPPVLARIRALQSIKLE